VLNLKNVNVDGLRLNYPLIFFTNGIHLTGGGALLYGLGQRLGARIKLPIHVSDDPLRAVVKGTGEVLQDLDRYRSVLIS
jgi:rod shape-determining protein MreB